MARLAHALALETPHIKADVVEVQEFPNLAQLYAVRSVPKTVVNRMIQFVGAIPESDFVDKVLEAGVRDVRSP